MKKTIAYTATAILLGLAIMMLPLALETGPPTYRPQLQPELVNTLEGRKSLEQQFGLATRPTTLLPTSLIIFTGLITALSTYIIVKKRMS